MHSRQYNALQADRLASSDKGDIGGIVAACLGPR